MTINIEHVHTQKGKVHYYFKQNSRIPSSIFSEGDFRKWLYPDLMASARTSKDVGNCILTQKQLFERGLHFLWYLVTI